MDRPKSLITVIALVLLGVACNQNYSTKYASATHGGAKPVLVEKLELISEPIPIEASGILGSKAEVKLSFKISGIVEGIYVEEGQTVRAGQLLAKLNMVEINAQVNQARNALDKAERDLTRAGNLYEDSVITLEQLEDLTTVYEVSKADVQIATFNQKYARILAPENGRVLKRFVEEGELVNGGSPVFLVGNTAKDAFVMRIGVADKDIVRMQYQDSAHVTFDAYAGKKFTAFVSEIAESADPTTGAFEIELTVNPNDINLKNGFVGKVNIFPKNQDPYYRISMSAMVEGERETAQVFMLESRSKTVKKVNVRPDHIGDGFFTVLATNLGQGLVITDGAAYLSEGDEVYVVN